MRLRHGGVHRSGDAHAQAHHDLGSLGAVEAGAGFVLANLGLGLLGFGHLGRVRLLGLGRLFSLGLALVEEGPLVLKGGKLHHLVKRHLLRVHLRQFGQDLELLLLDVGRVGHGVDDDVHVHLGQTVLVAKHGLAGRGVDLRRPLHRLAGLRVDLRFTRYRINDRLALGLVHADELRRPLVIRDADEHRSGPELASPAPHLAVKAKLPILDAAEDNGLFGHPRLLADQVGAARLALTRPTQHGGVWPHALDFGFRFGQELAFARRLVRLIDDLHARGQHPVRPSGFLAD